ncbi:MAG: glycosyltransferase family 4 protein [Pseudomonadota bacterium]
MDVLDTKTNEPLSNAPLRVAFGSVPKDGGTFTFYRNIRPALLEMGVEMRCVTVGQQQASLLDQRFWDGGCVILAQDVSDLRQQAKEFVRWCESEQIDIVIGVNSHGILAALPHLPQSVRALARCANGFDEGYQLTLVGLERLMRIVALVPMLQDDLVRDYAVDPDLIELIPNGVDPRTFNEAAQKVRGQGARLELGFVGRLEHRQKGVLHIPEVLAHFRALNIPFRLRIVGRGKHEDQLRNELADFASDGSVAFLGSQSASEVADLLGDTDVFLFPSHFEGCPNALLEAMMAGAVPASWRLPGITDFIIEDSYSGFLSSVGDHAAIASQIAKLHADRDLLRQMSANAAMTARQRFHNQVCAKQYSALFQQVMREPVPDVTPLPWSRFRPAPVLAPSLVHRLRSYARRQFRGDDVDRKIAMLSSAPAKKQRQGRSV